MAQSKNVDIIDLTCNSDDRPIRKHLSPSAEPESRASRSTEIAMASYNIWFGNTGYEKQRMEAIVQALSSHAPSLIGFQEVTPSLAQILCPLLESFDYHVILQPFMSYGCALACKVDKVIQSGYHPFSNSDMDRGILWALVCTDDREVLFTTTHLESYMDPCSTGASKREVQLVEMAEFCERCLRERPSVDLALITGDLNWDDERVRSEGHNAKLLSLIDSAKWVDTYRQVEPNDPGFTYDSKENPMLGGKTLRRRFDRILAHPRNANQLLVKRVAVVGKDALPGLKYATAPPRPVKRRRSSLVGEGDQGGKSRLVAPSDHFGLVSTLDF